MFFQLSGNIEQVTKAFEQLRKQLKLTKLFPGTGGDSDTIVDYYSQLTQSEVAALFKKYQLDFELYGYDPEPYFDIAQIVEP